MLTTILVILAAAASPATPSGSATPAAKGATASAFHVAAPVCPPGQSLTLSGGSYS